jgi:hypothetical protein
VAPQTIAIVAARSSGLPGTGHDVDDDDDGDDDDDDAGGGGGIVHCSMGGGV